MSSILTPSGWQVEPDVVDERKEIPRLSAVQIAAINMRIAAGSQEFPTGTTVIRTDDNQVLTKQGIGTSAAFAPSSAAEALDAIASGRLPYTDPLAPSYLKTMSDLVNGEEVSLFRFIPVAKQAAIFAQTDVSDLTANFQQAFDAVRANKRGAIFVPAGLYNINQVNMPARLRLRGAGRQTILQAMGAFANNAMLYGANADDMELSGVQITADRVSYPDLKCVLLENGLRPQLHDLFMPHAGGFGIFTYGITDGDYCRVVVNDAQKIGIYHANAVRGKTRACSVSLVQESHGISVNNSSDVEVSGCSTSQVGQFGLSFNIVTRGMAIAHRSQNSKLEGINLLDSSYCEVSDPHVSWTGDATWASTDFGISMWGDGIAGGKSWYNKVHGGIVIAPNKSGIALADDCQFNTIDGLTVINPNGLNEAQGAAVLLYGAGVQNNVVSDILAWADNGKMRYGVNEFNGGTGTPSNNRIRSIVGTGNTAALVNNQPTSSYVTTPSSGTLATLAGAETLTNKTVSGPSAIMTGLVQGSTVQSTGPMLSTNPAGGVGYTTGAGGTVTQLTSKATGVTINKVCGDIITSAASLAAGGLVAFTVNNSSVAVGDLVIVHRRSGGTASSYFMYVDSVAAGSFVVVLQNGTAGALAEAVTINFAVIKAVTT